MQWLVIYFFFVGVFPLLRLSSKLRHIFAIHGMKAGRIRDATSAIREYLNTKLADSMWLMASAPGTKDTVRSG